MNLLLYSDFSNTPKNELTEYFGNLKNKICLFCAYADEDAHSYIKREKNALSKIFENIIDLTPNYKFKDKIDCIFISGGYNFELSYKLKKYNQFDKIKNIVKSGVLYIGNSAGSVMAGVDFEFTLNYEPPRFELEIDSNKYGFGFIKNNVLVHFSKYIYSVKSQTLAKEEGYINHLKVKYIHPDYITIPNNGVAIVKDNKIKIKKYSWNKILKYNLEKNSG